MAAAINVTCTVQVSDGPKLSVARTLSVETYDVIDVTIAGDNTSHQIELQPSTTAGSVRCLVLTAGSYSSDLSYSVNADETDPADRTALDQVQLLLGAGAISLLGAEPNSLFFYNDTGQDIDVHLLVGRNVSA